MMYTMPGSIAVTTNVPEHESPSRFLDPTLSVSSFPLPGIECQPEGATSCRISHPSTPGHTSVATNSPPTRVRTPATRCCVTSDESVTWEKQSPKA
jgi:hypothetical protein